MGVKIAQNICISYAKFLKFPSIRFSIFSCLVVVVALYIGFVTTSKAYLYLICCMFASIEKLEFYYNYKNTLPSGLRPSGREKEREGRQLKRSVNITQDIIRFNLKY